MPNPIPPAADRNLLFGILALQMDFVSRDQVIAAMHAWVLDKTKPLGQILLASGALRPDTHPLLAALVDKHLELHGGDPARSLGTVTPVSGVRAQLQQIADPDLQASLAQLADVPATPENLDATRGSSVFEPVPAGRRFRVLRPHARGGLGEVFVAHDEELHRDVALKEIQERHADNADSRTRFLLEAEITGRLEHPGIVPVYGLGVYPDGRPFYAMRFIKGDSLKDAVARFHTPQAHGSPPVGFESLALRGLLRRFVDVCNAVAYAHSRGVLHRDLKPGNVMLGPYGETLVVDWGLAKVLGASEADSSSGESVLQPVTGSNAAPTQLGKALGTPAYMSPEQAGGRLDRLGPRSDVYSLGATLYTLLTNQTPFQQSEAGDLLARVERGDFPPPRQVNKTVPRALEAVCLKAMAHNPEARYATPRALAGDLEHWLADEPVSAYREPWTGRARRWLKRHRAAVLAAVAVLALAAVGLAVATALLSAKNEELTRANASEQAAKRQEQAAREQAQRNFQTAFQAVEDYLTGVAENERLSEKDLEPLRRDLFRSAQEFYRRFAAQERDSPKYRSLAAQADIALGLVHKQLGEREQAKAHFARAVTALRALAEAEPGQFAHRERLVRATLEMADLVRLMEDYKAAETWARDGLRLQQQLRQDFPAEPKTRELEVSAHLSLGHALAEGLRTPEAEKEYREALRLQEGLVKPQGDWQGTLAVVRVHAQLGSLFGMTMRRYADAEKTFRAALGLLDGLAVEARAKPRVRSEWAACQRGLADALLHQARSREAEEGHRAAMQVYERLAAEFPMIPSYRVYRANAYHSLAECFSLQGRAKETREMDSREVEAWEKLVQDFPAIPYYRGKLANACYALGRTEYKLGNKEESLRQRRKSVEIMSPLVKEYPDVAEYRLQLTAYRTGLGFALAGLLRFDEARAEVARALEVIRPLVAKHPLPEYQLHYALTLSNYSDLLAVALKAEDALAHAREAVAVLEKLTAAAPSVEHRMYLGGACLSLALRLKDSSRRADAHRTLERGVQTLEEVLLQDARLGQARGLLKKAHEMRLKLLAGLDLKADEVKDGQRALSLAHTGKGDDARGEADTLAAGKELSAAGCYTLARVFALLAAARPKDDVKGREDDGDRALALLHRARDAGYFKEAARVERLRREPDLAPLRDRADFQKLSGGGK